MYSAVWHVSEFVFHVKTFVSIVESLYYRTFYTIDEGGVALTTHPIRRRG